MRTTFLISALFVFLLNILPYFHMLSRIILGVLLSFHYNSYTYFEVIWEMQKAIEIKLISNITPNSTRATINIKGFYSLFCTYISCLHIYTGYICTYLYHMYAIYITSMCICVHIICCMTMSYIKLSYKMEMIHTILCHLTFP